VAGYEVGIRVGEFLGRSHYRIFHTTATAGTLAAAAAVGRLLGLTPEQMQHAFGSAGTQSAGLWEFLRTGADSKQLHTAHAAAAGLMSAYLAQDGFTGAQDIFTGPQGLAGHVHGCRPTRLTDGLGTRWATAETSFKWHASCRHTHPAADALLQVMQQHGLAPADLAQVTCHVHQGAIDVLGPVVGRHRAPEQVLHGHGAGAGRASRPCGPRRSSTANTWHHRGPAREGEHGADAEVDAAYPRRWIGKVSVLTTDGRTLHGRVEEPKGDPGNTLSREEITAKALRLIAYGGALQDDPRRRPWRGCGRSRTGRACSACWTEFCRPRPADPRERRRHRAPPASTKVHRRQTMQSTNPFRRRLVHAAAAACALLPACAGALASSWPEKPVVLVVPYSAGGPTDVVARLLAIPMGQVLGQSVLVENTVGAGGTIAPARVAKAKADGYTILIHHMGMATAPALYKKLPYDPLKDFEYIGQVLDVPMTLLSRKDFPASNFAELLDYVRKNQDKVSLANAGIGAVSQLCGMLFMHQAGVKLTTVPYKGAGPP
jgi:hypothetical protein